MITSWSHWSVGRRIGCAFLVVVIGMGLLTALGVQRVGGISDRLTTINDLNSVKQRYAINFRGSVHDRAIAVRDVVLAADASQVDEEVDRIAALTTKYSASEVKLTALFAEPGAVNDRERAARADIDGVQTATLPLIEQVVALKRAGNDAGALQLLVAKAKPQFVEWLRTINVLIDLEEAQNKVESDAARGIASSFLPLMLLVGLVAAALAALVAWRTTRSVTRPLGEAAEVMAEVARGDLRRRIQVRGDDEVARVARSTNSALDTLSEVIGTIRTSAQSLTSSSGTLTSLTGAIADSADDAAARADVVSTAAEDVSRNVQVVATGADEMGLSIRQIAQNANEAARVAGAAVRTAHETNDTVGKIGASSREIGDVVKVITSIAAQTNLLALNATIEAARAGDSGKGFAVVANEVKELAQATARATDDISRRIEAIQADTAGAVAAIGRIGDVIGEINDYQTVIAAAVEEQTSTTNEMSRSVGDAAHGTAQIASNVGGVAAAASATRACVEDSRSATRAVGELSAELRGLVEHFTL